MSLQHLCERKMSPELIAYLSTHPAVTLALTETVKYLTKNPSPKSFRVRFVEVTLSPPLYSTQNLTPKTIYMIGMKLSGIKSTCCFFLTEVWKSKEAFELDKVSVKLTTHGLIKHEYLYYRDTMSLKDRYSMPLVCKG